MHRNPDSALKLGQARGAAICAAVAAGASAHEYAPRAIKLAISGFGAADKLQVARMVTVLLGLPRRPEADAADALAVALCHAQARRLAMLGMATAVPQAVAPTERAEPRRRRSCGFARLIASLAGLLVQKSPPALVVEVGGVGYELEAPMSTFYQLPPVGQPVRLLTHLVVREDAHFLYGFGSDAERAPVPRAAEGLGRRSADRAGDPLGDHGRGLRRLRAGGRRRRADASIPGVGRKIAERLIVEMRDRLAVQAGAANAIAAAAPTGVAAEAYSALLALGYRPAEATRLLKNADPNGSTEELIRGALQGAARE